MRTFILLAVFLVTAFAPFVVAHADEDDLVLGTFDISDLTAPRSHRRAPRLGALEDQMWMGEVPELEDPAPFLDPETVVDLIRERVDYESWDSVEGASIQVLRDVLYVQNTGATVRKAAAFLERLSALGERRALVRVRVLEGASVAESASIEVPFGVQRALKVTNRIRFVGDYDVEIAQGSTITDPVVYSAEEGLAADLVVDPTLDGSGLVVEALLQRGKYGPMRRLELGPDEEYFPRPFRSERRSHLGTLELPTFDRVDAHVTAVVPSGGTVTIPVAQGDRRLTLELRAELLGAPPMEDWLEIGSLVRRPLPVRYGYHPEAVEVRHLIAPGLLYLEEDPSPRFSIEEVVDLVRQTQRPEYWDEAGYLLGLQGDLLYVGASAAMVEQVRRFLQGREASSIRPVELGLELFSVAGDVAAGPERAIDPESARLVTAGRIPTLTGRTASLLAGSAMSYLADYDVEVAQEARVSDPVIAQSFDGLVANLTPRAALDGQTVAVDVELLLADRTLSTEPFVTGAQFHGPIDRVHTKRVVVDTTVRVPAGGTYVLDVGPDPADGSRRLALQVRATLP